MRFATCLLLASALHADPDYYQHVFFDNSLTPDRYYYSEGSAVAPSTLAVDHGRLPVDTHNWFTPPNAIRLQWTSAPNGSWEATVRLENWRNHPVSFDGDTLRIWLYSPEPVSAEHLPVIQLGDSSGAFTAPVRIGQAVPARKWTVVRISRFASASVQPFDIRALQTVSFLQSQSDGREHTLFVDEIAVEPATAATEVLTAPPALRVTGYDRHIDLSWSPVDGARRYVIQRSFDGQRFDAIAIQDPRFTRFSDFLGEAGRKAWYRVTASGTDYRESPPSQTAAATTRAFTDDELLTMVQEASFRYYMDGAEPNSGMALESIPGDPHMIATGASGFGMMALLVGVERGFIARAEGIARLQKIVDFLAKADRFHGVWPHFLDGRTGRVMPVFGKYDNGGDLVETAFLVQGLLAARQFFNHSDPAERSLAAGITRLWETVEWDWYRRDPASDFLYWHWSPQFTWHINHRLIGWNETMIVYLLAIASPTHGVPATMYYSGWASQSEFAQQYRRAWSGTTDGDHYLNGKTYDGIRLDVGEGRGGPLFFTHYSFLGFDPRGQRDRYTNYFHNNRAIARINRAWCIRNPGKFKGYGEQCWGLTASDGPSGYKAHEPNEANDDGTITPTGAISSFPYTPEDSLAALKYFYRDLGPLVWGTYGFRDAFNLQEDWVARIYMGLNEAPMAVMIENYRSGLIWKCFMANPEIRPALQRIGFAPDEVK